MVRSGEGRGRHRSLAEKEREVAPAAGPAGKFINVFEIIAPHSCRGYL